MCVLLARNRYFVEKGLNYIENFNEFVNLVISFMIMVLGSMPFNGSVPESHPNFFTKVDFLTAVRKYNLGTLLNYAVLFMFLVNLCFVVTSIIN